jgi:hypothetical protein
MPSRICAPQVYRASAKSAPAPRRAPIDPLTETEEAAPVLAAPAALAVLDLLAVLEGALEELAGEEAAGGEAAGAVGPGAPEEAPFIWAWIDELLMGRG